MPEQPTNPHPVRACDQTCDPTDAAHNYGCVWTTAAVTSKRAAVLVATRDRRVVESVAFHDKPIDTAGTVMTTIEIDPTTGLPVLEIPCPDCTSDEYREMRAQNNRDWRRWNEEEQTAFAEFAAEYEKTHPIYYTYEEWQRSGTCRELLERQPEELPEAGCGECIGRGMVPTPAGNAIMFLVAKYRSAR
jgi:hypothetical protein